MAASPPSAIGLRLTLSLLLLVLSRSTALFNQPAQLLLNSITTDNSTILAPATYTLSLSRYSASPVPLNSYLLLTFSPEYLGSIAASPSCRSSSFGNASLSCSFSGATLYVTQLFSNSSFLSVSAFSIAVSNITNPSPATDYTPVTSIQIIAPSNAVVDSSTASVVLTVTPGAASCGSSILNPYVYQNGQISVSYSSNYIASGSSGYNLALEVPTSYPDDATSNSIALTLSVPFTTVSSTGTYFFELGFVNSFTMSMLMPPSTKPETDFISIYSYNSQGVVDSCELSISQVQPNTFSALSISQEVVQTSASIKFDLTLATPLAPTDYLILSFDKAFDLTAVGSTVSISGFGIFTLSKYNNSLLQVTAISQQPVLNARLIFTLSGVMMPFTTAPAYLNISLQTSEKVYFRIVQNYLYVPAPGSIVASVACLSVQVGAVDTSCVFTVKTSSTLTSNGLFNIVLPSSFPMSDGSSQCQLSGAGLTSFTYCTYYLANNTIQVPKINSTISNIANTTFTLTLTLSMSQYVGAYSIKFTSESSGSVVDSGNVALTTTSRKLKTAEFAVVSSSGVTSSSTVYTLYFSLPFSLGVTYTVVLSFPFEVQGNLSVLLNGAGATLVSFSSQILTFTSNQLTNNASVTVNNMQTPSSLQPTQISVNITYLNTTYFYGSTSITMTQARTFNYASLQTSNQVVYSPAVATFSLSSLLPSSKIVLTANYPYFYSSSQPNCSATVSCGLSGVLSVVSANSTGVTTFSINIRNNGYVGQTQLNVTEYDSMQIYPRQSSLLTLTVSTPNVITVSTNQTNPYLAESSTYTFTLTLSTPNASSLLLTPPSGLIVTSATCQLNCGAPSKLTVGYLFSVTSTNCIVTLTLTNPTSFGSSNTFVFKTSNSYGDMDYGQYTPQLVCNSPCRSCSNNTSVCLTCYTWSSEAILYNGTCVGACPVGQYNAANSAGILICSVCGSYCAVCSGSANNCSTCLNGSFYYNFGCYPTCPLGSFTVTYFCSSCLQTNCSVCNSTTCTKCFSPNSFFNGSCLSVCLSNYYSLSGECVPCASTCLTCSPYNGTCLACLSPNLLYGGSCYSSCPAGVYQQVNAGICESCQPPCSGCQSYSTTCTSCLRTYNSTNYYYFSSQCYSKCLDGYYGDSTTSLCVLCPSGCTSCTSSACLSCSSPLYLYQGVCYSVCPSGTYANSTTCIKCISICSACVSVDTCTGCIGGYNLYNSSCLINCPIYYYANLTGSVCLACSSPCVQCTYQGCTTCITGYYLQQNICTTSCTGVYHPNNSTMICETCQLPCAGCTWSNLCTFCTTGYSLFGTSCLSSCPSGYYSDGSQCLSCPSLCPTCTFRNNKPACTSCATSSFLYSFNCTAVCPSGTIATGQTCYSSDCSSLAHCVSCSGQQCLQCSSLYQMDSSYACSSFVSGSAISNAIFKIPVPFPFLIATIMVLIIAFLLRHNFNKMFSPLFVYPLAGCLEFLCLCLWTLLSVFWNMGVESPLPYASVVYAPVLIASAYVIFNILQFVFWIKIVRADRQYKLWQKQDNLCASYSIAIIALIFSFRLDALKFSRTAHNPRLSARLASPDSFKQYSVLAILSLILNSTIILVSVYISYLQTSMNYLFFTGIQIALISIIMIIFSIAMLCVSRQQLLEDRSEYQVGYDQDNLEGKSVEELLGVVEEHHEHCHYDDTGNAVLLNNDFSESGSQDLTLIEPSPAQHLQFEDKVKQANEAKSEIESDDIFGYTPEERDSSNHILIDEIERDKQEALELTTHYKLADQPQPSTFPRQTGAIVKQRLPDLHEDSSDVESMQSFEQFRLDYSKGKWQKEGIDGLVTEKQEIQGEFIQEFHIKQLIQEKIKKEQEERKKQEEERRIFEEKQRIQAQKLRLIEEEKLRQANKEKERLRQIEEEKIRQANRARELILQKQREQQLRKENQRKRVEQQQRKRKQEQIRVKEQRVRKIEEQKKREERWKQMKEQQKRKKQEEERLLKEKLERMRQEQLQLKKRLKQEERIEKLRLEEERKLQLQISKRELQKLEKLKSELQNLEGLTEEFQARNHQLQLEESQLHFAEKQKERESKERALMGVEDRLSRMAKVFEQMWKKAAEIKQRPSRTNKIQREEEKSVQPSQEIRYKNDDTNNLVPELSPRKIKVNPKPLPQQYTRKHLFVEQGTEILQSSGDEQQYDEDLQIVFEGGEAKIVEDQAVEKPKSHIHRHKSSKTKISHLIYQDKEKKQIQQLKINKKTPQLPYPLATLRSNPHKSMSKEDSEAPINMVVEDSQIQYTQQQEKQQSLWSHPNDLQQDIRSPHRPQSIRSDIMSVDTHWPIEPQMHQRILEVERRADRYLNEPKRRQISPKKYLIQDPGSEIYEQQQEGETQMGEIVFEESDQMLSESKTMGSAKKRYPLGRVNRRVIDLSPQ